MRAFLRRIGPRYGVGLGLIALLVVILGIARLMPHSSAGTLVNSGSATLPQVSPGPPDDGLPSPGSPPPPRTSPGADPPEQIATDFADAWLRHDGVSETDWYATISTFCTSDLRAQFAGVDPAGVPADQVTGPLTTIDYAASYVQVEVPVNGGTVVLGLRATEGRWLVDTVDWNPS